MKIPLLEDLGVEIDDGSFILYIIPDDLEFNTLKRLDESFDKFELIFMSNQYNLLKLKFVIKGDWMYSNEEKKQLMDDLKEMETFKADTGDEGKILQKDLKDYYINQIGDEEDLIFRLELYFYAFKLFCRKSIKINRNQFTVYLNDSILEWDLIKLVMDDLNEFELEIEAVKENNDVLINLNFTLHF